MAELDILIPQVESEEALRQRWYELSAQEVQFHATRAYGEVTGAKLAARRALQLQMAKMT